MEAYRRLLLANHAWAQEKVRLQPNYFRELALDQQPDFLWIGCSDSRVPAEEITGVQPGETFVHRNIANLVHANDLNLNSVLQYAVSTLKVKHIIVCGHFGCGGVRASLSTDSLGLLDHWLAPLKALRKAHDKEFADLKELKEQTNRLVELSVKQQIQNLAATEVMKTAWTTGRRPLLHGWVFDMETGLLRTVQKIDPAEGSNLETKHLPHL